MSLKNKLDLIIMAIEKVGDQVYIINKELYDEAFHTYKHAIKNNDIELLDYIMDTYYFTLIDYIEILEYCILDNDLKMIKYIVENKMSCLTDANIFTIINHVMHDNVIKNKKIKDYLDNL